MSIKKHYVNYRGQQMRNQFSKTLYEVAVKDERICVVVADISPGGSMADFREKFPDRFIDVGVSEQGMIGLCAGLALRGLRPFAYTIATFSVYRPFEMIRVDLCYQNLPVTVVGMGAGIIYSTLGATHHTQEDISVLNGLPNLSILAPCDPLELVDAVHYCGAKSTGPIYLRVGKVGESVFTQNALDTFEFGKIRRITQGEDVCILTFGVVVNLAAKVAEALKERGKSVTLVSCHTLKPFDTEGVAQMLKGHKEVIVIEEHSCIGGLASLVKQAAWDCKASCELKTFSLKDEFVHCYGSHDQLRSAHGLDVDFILSRVT
jgi:transketolase